jgi:hypothetical protein
MLRTASEASVNHGCMSMSLTDSPAIRPMMKNGAANRSALSSTSKIRGTGGAPGVFPNAA